MGADAPAVVINVVVAVDVAVAGVDAVASVNHG